MSSLAGGEVAEIGVGILGYVRAAEVCDAIVRSGASGNRESVSYRTL